MYRLSLFLLLLSLGAMFCAIPTKGQSNVSSSNINSIQWIGGTSMTDLGQQFNTAEANLPTNGGEIDVIPPTVVPPNQDFPFYIFQTAMVFNKTVKLKCVRGGYANGNTDGTPVNGHLTSLLAWSGTATVPPIQIGTPIPLATTGFPIVASGGTGTVSCPTTCVVYPGQLLAILNSNYSSFNYNNDGKNLFYITNVLSPTQFQFATSISHTATGGSIAIIGAAIGSSVEGCQFSYFPQSGTVAPPVFVDIDSGANHVTLDRVTVDNP